MFEPTAHRLPKVGRRQDDWWRGAVIYQIYPRSFMDSDGNGIGDLPGIVDRLDYVAELGVNVVWISPFMTSPMKDFGYDVADYCGVDPIFGTLADFDRLVARARELGLRVIVDFVASHTSNEHAWFKESRRSRTNPKADWYVWADARPEGSPPNNWQSVFGGAAWAWEPRRGQYYLHNFLKEQPDLNFHNPAVIDALLAQADFWLQRGIDGFRLDAIDFGVHDPQLRDNPPRPRDDLAALSGPGASPFAMQYQLWNKARPELSDLFFKPLHALTERYGGKMLLGEISGDRALHRMAEYSDGGGLDIAYSFDLLTCEPKPSELRRIIAAVEEVLADGWACWSFCNHDVTRAVTRFAAGQPATDALRAMLPILLCSLRGTPCLYQGEELGLEEAELSLEQIRDPYGLTFWPDYKGRDGCRTPMPWSAAAPHAGFTIGGPWLPVPAAHRALAVDAQRRDPQSPLNRVREFLSWRRSQPVLIRGSIAFADDHPAIFAFTRALEAQTFLCAFNLQPAAAEMPAPPGRTLMAAPGASLTSGRASLPAHGWLIADMTGEA